MTGKQIRLFCHNCIWPLIRLIISMSITRDSHITDVCIHTNIQTLSVTSIDTRQSLYILEQSLCTTHNPPEDIFTTGTGNTGHSTRTTRVTGCSIVMQSANSHHLHDFCAAPFLCTKHCLSLILLTQLPSPTETFCSP